MADSDEPTDLTGAVTNRPAEEAGFNERFIRIESTYGGGSLVNIELKDLVGNEVATKQLMNSHNDQCRRRIEAERRLSDKESEIEFLKTTPFMAALSLVVSTGGTIVVGIGVNLATANPRPAYSVCLVWIGFGLVFLGGVASTLYPLARKWFNRKSRAT